MHSLLDLVVIAEHPGDSALAEAIATKLGLPFGNTAIRQWQLMVSGGQRNLIRPDGTVLSIDFINGSAARHAKEPDLRKQPLSKAIGIASFQKQHQALPRVLDATAGLAQDAWLMAHLGCSVQLIEQSSLLVLMIESALSVALGDIGSQDTAKRLSVQQGNSTLFMNAHEKQFDVVYLDPMYPVRRKSAKVKKAMQFLHELVGPQTDEAELLASALLCAKHRVVVKRPAGADPLNSPESIGVQKTIVEAPNTRYDVYHL